MQPLLSPEQMRRADERCIAAGTGAEVLMDRAGRAVARRVIELLGRRYGSRVAVVCGPGNNGGDGLVAARVLTAEGIAVRCFLVSARDQLRGAAAIHLRRAEAAGVDISTFDPETMASFEADLAIDALFGTGFSGRVDGSAARAVAAISAAPLVVAIDIPSGVDGATGACEGPCVRADLTVAIAAEKWGTSQPPGSLHAGRVEVADIGIAVADGDADAWMVEAEDVAGMLPQRSADAHKRSAGSVVIIAGSDDMPGAAVLSAVGALRMGAGYVSLGTTGEPTRVAHEVVPEVLSTRVADTKQLDAASLAGLADALGRADAVAVGPGLGRGEGPAGLVRALLEEIDVPLVLDADALNVLEGDLSPVAGRAAPTVLTPHPGEMATLLGCAAADVAHDRLTAAREAASKAGAATILLKGQRTVVVSGRRSFVIRSGGPELATAGSGDVLTGAIAALCAASGEVLPAAVAGAHVHGIAGALAGQRVGSAGVTARDVADELGRAADLVSGSRYSADLL